MQNLFSFLQDITIARLSSQQVDGSFLPGHNGLYHHPETPVRNTCHCLITLLYIYETTGDKQYRTAAENALSYIQGVAEDSTYTLHHRTIHHKDACNGLIGPAWSMEAFVEAGEVLEDDTATETAVELYGQHPFDASLGLWKIREIDGRVTGFDYTFNHQLWFAASAAYINDVEARKNVLRFLDRLPENMLVHQSGRIVHYIPAFLSLAHTKGLKKAKKSLSIINFLVRKKRGLTHKENGYHLFNLYAFARLRTQFPNHAFWQSDRCCNIVQYAVSEGFLDGLSSNKYAYGYNAPGFALPYIFEVFSDILTIDVNEQQELLQKVCGMQLTLTYDASTHMYSNHTEDPLTLTARMYELCRASKEYLSGISIGTYDD